MNAAQHTAQTAVRLASQMDTTGMSPTEIVVALAVGLVVGVALVFFAKKGL